MKQQCNIAALLSEPNVDSVLGYTTQPFQLTGSQCSCIRDGVTCSHTRSSKTSRAAAFWTHCSGASVICDKPAETELQQASRVVMNASISRTVRSRRNVRKKLQSQESLMVKDLQVRPQRGWINDYQNRLRCHWRIFYVKFAMERRCSS